MIEKAGKCANIFRQLKAISFYANHIKNILKL